MHADLIQRRHRLAQPVIQADQLGPSIAGTGRCRYRYEGGSERSLCIAGFAIRRRELVVYLLAESPEQLALREKLGKHRMGKSCLYFKRLADLDIVVLERLITESVAELRRRYPDTGG